MRSESCGSKRGFSSYRRGSLRWCRRVSEEPEVQLKLEDVRAPGIVEERAALEHQGQELGVLFNPFYG